jgi:hypothetical protein
MSELCVVAIGAGIGFYTGDPLRLLEDAQILKPQLFPTVPRVLNRIYQAAMVAGRAPGLKGALFRRALAVKLEKLHATGDNTHPVWDRLVFRKVHRSSLIRFCFSQKTEYGSCLMKTGAGRARWGDRDDWEWIGPDYHRRYGLSQDRLCVRCHRR